jgi:hypothetical protein
MSEDSTSEPSKYPWQADESPGSKDLLSRVGLCLNCRHAHVVRSAKGSVFYRCDRSAGDPAFPKYPRLPVRECAGFERGDPDSGRQSKA